jgi:transcriptional regulator with XRE-family HTH domain
MINPSGAVNHQVSRFSIYFLASFFDAFIVRHRSTSDFRLATSDWRLFGVCRMSESFGARLRRRREEQQIALATIAERTKIKQSLLDALERDDISHWPTGIFRRAFVRAYAHAIGFDPDVAVKEFFEVYPEPVEMVTTAALAAATDAARGTGATTRFRSFLGSFSRRRWIPSGDDGRDDAVTSSASVPRRTELPNAVDDVRRMNVTTPEPDFLAIADLCTQFARVEQASDVRPLLHEAAIIVHAVGIVVWVWDSLAEALRPAMASEYSEALLAHLPNVRRDDDNVTAVAFRSGQACSIDGDGRSALAIPLLIPGGCAGVLAFELNGVAPTDSVRAAAMIVAAQLSQLIGEAQPSEVQAPELADSHAQLAC